MPLIAIGLLLFLQIFLGDLQAAEAYPAKIRNFNGAPTLFVNKQPTAFSALRSWNLHDQQQEIYRSMSRAGVGIFFVSIAMGDIMVENGCDFKVLDSKIKEILVPVPEALIIVDLGLHHKMFPYYDKNPDERTMDALEMRSSAPVQEAYACISFGSEKFRRDMAEVLRELTRHIARTSHAGQIIGFQLSYGAYNEWIPWGLNTGKFVDFNPQYIERFRIWLKGKYHNDEALAHAWNMTAVTFSTALPFAGTNTNQQQPASGRFHDPAQRMQLLDTREFAAFLVSDTQIFFAEVLKQATLGQALVGMYAGANYQYQDLSRLLASDAIDFFCSSTGYVDRGINGVTYDQAFTLESLRAHGKLYCHDADIRTYLFPGNKVNHFGKITDFGRLSGAFSSAMVLRREWGAMLTHGAGITWFNIVDTPGFQSPVIMREIARMTRAGQAASAFDRGSKAEIAVIVKPNSTHHSAFYRQDAIRSELYRIGAPVDIYTLSDLPKVNPLHYKLIVALLCQRLNAEEAAAFDKLKRSNTTIVWTMGSGYLTETGFSIEAMSRLTGFKFEPVKGDLPYMLSSGNRQRSYIPGMTMSQAGAGYFAITDYHPEEQLGCDPEGRTVSACRKFHDWQSVIYPGYAVAAADLRDMAAKAGVHIYVNDNAGFYANRHFLVLSAPPEGGTRRISLPEEQRVWDIFTEQEILLQNRSFTLELAPGTVTVLFNGNQQEVQHFRQLYESSSNTAEAWNWTPAVKQPFTLKVVDGCKKNLTTGESNEIRLRLAAHQNLDAWQLKAVLPELWQAKPVSGSALSAGQVYYCSMPITPPPTDNVYSFALQFELNAGQTNGNFTADFQVAPFTYLSDLPWRNSTSGWKQTQIDRAVSGRTLAIGNHLFAKGLGTHAPSQTIFDLNGQYAKLTGFIGIDDGGGKSSNGRASVVFTIVGNGKLLYRSELKTGGATATPFSLDISGVNTLLLDVSDGGDGKIGDHADWADLKLSR